jgi:hypothetical protein
MRRIPPAGLPCEGHRVDTWIAILRSPSPPAARILAALAMGLGRLPTLTESGIPRSTYYRHIERAALLWRSHSGIGPDPEMGARSHSGKTIHSGAEFSPDSRTDERSEKTEADRQLTPNATQKTTFSTGQRKTINNQSLKGAESSAPLNWTCDAQILNRLRSAHAEALKRGADVPALDCGPESLRGLRSRLEEHDPDYVISVAIAALEDAEHERIPGVWWARIFVGSGFEARASAYDRTQAPTRKISDVEIATLKACGAVIA